MFFISCQPLFDNLRSQKVFQKASLKRVSKGFSKVFFSNRPPKVCTTQVCTQQRNVQLGRVSALWGIAGQLNYY